MSTTHHTAIANGAAANASTFNTPLGQLDQAIQDNLTASSSETVAARSAGETSSAAASLTERMEWLQGNKMFSAEAYGMAEGNTGGDNLTALNNAANAARAVGGVVVLPAGEFNISGWTLANDDIKIMGSGMPYLNNAGTALVGGTILRGGTISLNGKKRLVLMNLGIDVSGITGDAIQSGSNATTQQNVLIQNVITLGSGASGSHGCSLTSGSHNIIDNFTAIDFDHGLALRCSHSRASNVLAQNCASSTVTLKAIDSVNCKHNVVTNIIGYGTASYNQGAVVVEAHNGADCKQNVISNVTIQNATYGLQVKTVDGGSGHGTTSLNSFDNMSFETIQFDGVRIQGNGTSSVGISQFNNILCRTLGAYGFRNLMTNDQYFINGAIVSSATQGSTFGPFAVRDINGIRDRSVQVSRSSAQAIPTATWTEITFNEAKHQTDDEFWDSGTNPEHLISPIDGRYQVIAHAVFDSDATGDRFVRIKRSQDGLVVSQASMPSVGGSIETHLECSYIQNMNQDTYFTVEVYQDSGSDLDLAVRTFASMEKR